MTKVWRVLGLFRGFGGVQGRHETDGSWTGSSTREPASSLKLEV
jgi:hypothetical protein